MHGETHTHAALARTIDAVPTPTSALVDAATPTRIGRFVIVERVGEGGMGQVFSAYDPELDRKVAIKLVRDLGDDVPLAVARVKLEAQAMARVSHPNVVHVYEAGESGGRVYLAMEFVDGNSLGDWQRSRDRGALGEVTSVLRVYLQAAAGLAAAHACGLIHRDFKPDNVLVGRDGRVRVADFGLARLLAGLDVAERPAPADTDPARPSQGGASAPRDARRRLTEAGAIMGTPGYMSPEQVQGVEADERSDQFSFCAALYESLYGRQPFAGGTYFAYAGSILAGRLVPPPPSEVPLVVQQAILRGLSLDPRDRFPSMQALMAALSSGLAPSSEPMITRTDRLRIGVSMVAALVLIEVSNGAVVMLTHSHNSLLRGVAIVGLFVGITAVLMRRPPWPVRHLDRYRRMTAFFMTTLVTFFFGRVAGLLFGVDANQYYTFEVITLAGILTVESLRVGWRHALLGFAALAYAPFIVLAPGLRVVLYNLLLTVVTVASVYLHMQQPHDVAADDVTT